MYPKGFVLAAAMTSHTSMPMRANVTFVHQSDVHRAEDVLEQLARLRHTRV
jgi:hypothetical protein